MQADHLIAEAEAQAAEVARQRAAAILSAARAEAARLTQAGIRRAADLTAIAARRRDQDVATVVAAVLPQPDPLIAGRGELTMMVPLTQLEVAGLRPSLDDALDSPAGTAAGRGRDHRRSRRDSARPGRPHRPHRRRDARSSTSPRPAPCWATAALRTTLDHLEPQVAKLLAEEEELRGEAEALPRSIDALDALQPLVPELGRLNDRQLANLGLASMALVLDDPDLRIVPELTRQLAELLGRGHLMVTSAATPGSPVGCLLVLRRGDLPEVNALLGTERIVEVGVPAAYAGKSLRATVEAMRERLAALPGERDRVQAQLAATVKPVAGSLHATIAALRARAERAVAATQADLSSRTFILRLWVPTKQTARVEQALADRLGQAVAVERLDTDAQAEDQPVLLRNRPGWQPFQQLVGLLSWPARGDLDPTGLTALALPIFFGVMVGDVVYGALLLAAGWWLRSHWPKNSTIGEVGRVHGARRCLDGPVRPPVRRSARQLGPQHRHASALVLPRRPDRAPAVAAVLIGHRPRPRRLGLAAGCLDSRPWTPPPASGLESRNPSGAGRSLRVGRCRRRGIPRTRY